MRGLVSWVIENWVELLAACISVTYVILTIREIIWLWLFGILSAVLYAWVYGKSGFYAGMSLQGYYAFISVYGWWHWSASGKIKNEEAENKEKLPVTRASLSMLIALIAAWMLLWFLIGYTLDHFTDSKIPYWDAFTTSGGVVATWMLARKLLEQWLFWIVIDAISIGLYLSQGLYATCILFVIYSIMAVFGYLRWKRAWLTTA